MTLQDSELLEDTVKAAIRTYLGRIEGGVREDGADPEMERLVGECRGLTALLNEELLPAPGRTVAVMVDVPDAGLTEFRLTRIRAEPTATSTYTGQAREGAMSILLIRDSIVAGRITTAGAVFNFRSGLYGLINVAPADTTGSVTELHLLQSASMPISAADDGVGEGYACLTDGGPC